MYILEELWWDYEVEKPDIQHSADYEARLKKLCREEEALEAALPPELKKAFERFTDAEWSLSAAAECEAFIRGVRCGGRLMLDMLA